MSSKKGQPSPGSGATAQPNHGWIGRALCLALILTAASGFSPVLRAQVTSGTIFGSVQDSTGAMVPNATVTATEPSKGVTRTTTASGTGTFSLPNLPPGTYTVDVTATGFGTLTKSGVILNAADSLNAGVFTLQVGPAASSVTVTADTGQLQIQTDSGERSDLITGKQLEEVATNGRNVLDYMRLIPGVAGVGQFGASGTGGLDSYNINGTRANTHEFTLDGSSDVDTGNNGGTHVTINPDAIAEVKVLTSNYQAEYGKASGGQISVVSAGGSNQFHGNAHFFHRNDGMNATGWYNNHNDIAKQLYRYNTEGIAVGGPIKHDKLFFFFSTEHYQQLVPGGTTSYYVPTDLERQGNFSQSITSAKDPQTGNNVPINIYEPGTQTQYANNTITSGLNSAIQALMSLYPEPNVAGYGTEQNTYNRVDALSFDNPRHEYIGRVDYQITPGERIFARWIGNYQSTVAPMGQLGLPCDGSLQIAGGCLNTQNGWNMAVDLTSTLGSHLLNEVSVGPSAYRSLTTGNNGNISVGANSNIDLPLLFPVSSSTSIPDVGYSGNGQNYLSSYFGATPWFQANTTINANDNLTWVKSNHTFKFGVFYQRNRKDQIAWGNSNGQYSFNNCATSNNDRVCAQDTGSPVASALLGDFQSFDQSSSRPTGYFRYNQLEFYAQDTWQVNSRLTLDYGMRFVWIPPQYDDKDQIALFDPSLYVKADAIQVDVNGNPIAGSGNPLEGMAYASNHTLPKGGWNDRGVMIEPRVGFSWDPIGDHKGVVRGGFGMSHDREQGNLVFNPAFNNPLLETTPTITSNTYLNLDSISTAPQNAPGVLTSVQGVDRTGQVPTVYSYSLGVQREAGFGITYDIAYVGTVSRHLITSRDINTIPYGTAFTKAAQNPANFAGGVVPDVEPNLPPEYAAAGYNFSGQYAYAANYLAPYSGYDQLPYTKFDGTANYNSLQASLQRRFGKGLTIGAVYTWSKSLTTQSDDNGFVDPFNPRLYNYQVASWDRRNVAAVNYVYDLPNVAKHFGNSSWLAYLTDNYQISGVSNFMTGTPNWTAFWVPANQLDGGRQWSKVPPAYLGFDRGGKPVIPAIGHPYAGTPDSIRSGGMQTWDVSLFKNIPLPGKSQRSIQLRCETYNLFNHSNFASKDFGATLNLPAYNVKNGVGTYTPESVVPDSGYGQPTSVYSQLGAGGPRVIQLGTRISF